MSKTFELCSVISCCIWFVLLTFCMLSLLLIPSFVWLVAIMMSSIYEEHKDEDGFFPISHTVVKTLLETYMCVSSKEDEWRLNLGNCTGPIK
jgi:hypothetical protein